MCVFLLLLIIITVVGGSVGYGMYCSNTLYVVIYTHKGNTFARSYTLAHFKNTHTHTLCVFALALSLRFTISDRVCTTVISKNSLSFTMRMVSRHTATFTLCVNENKKLEFSTFNFCRLFGKKMFDFSLSLSLALAPFN